MRRRFPAGVLDFQGPPVLLASLAAVVCADFLVASRWYSGSSSNLWFHLLEAACLVAIAYCVITRWPRKVKQPNRFAEALIDCFERSEAGVCHADGEGRVTNCNEAFASFVGHSREELAGAQLATLIDCEHLQDLASLQRTALSGGKCHYTFTAKFCRHNGGPAWGNVALSFVPESSGKLAAIIFVQDTTREQQALQALEAGEQELRRVLAEVQHNEQRVSLLARAVESATDSIVITDLDGRIEYVNPHFVSLTGYTREEVYGQNPRVLNSGRQSREFYADLWRTLISGGEWNGRFINRRKDGTLYTEEATIAPVRDAKGATYKYVAVKRDVTRLEELEQQLRQSQKMEAVGQLAGGIAHDLNNVLQVVTLASHLALTSDSNEFKDARIRETVAAAMKGAAVIRQLLAFGRRQVMRLEVLNLNEVVSDTAKLLRHLLPEDIQLCMKLDPKLGNIKADPVQVTQVVLNLAVNARDAMPNGGMLEITSSNFEADEAFVAIHPQMRVGSYARLTVHDTGTGMDEATKAHIFEPFFTTKEMGKGTGLGLSTVYGIVRQSEGHIEFDSAPGQGTTFVIYLPQTDEPIARAAGENS